MSSDSSRPLRTFSCPCFTYHDCKLDHLQPYTRTRRSICHIKDENQTSRNETRVHVFTVRRHSFCQFLFCGSETLQGHIQGGIKTAAGSDTLASAQESHASQAL
uniref:PPUP9740 n=1 Tax=Poeciliopsis prolifica TaxID=188132 RepID=A0A0S7ELH2_9TELE